MHLSEQTAAILRDTLGVTNLADIADRSFKDLADDVGHDELAAYAARGRGSVRLATGRFFTLSELQSWAKKVVEMKLP
ncbi:MAG: hypothetical protein HQL88_06315 [Magnetococcales bacterium]|nr:hypothetical protein [Magnetococcales bacterium]